MNNEDSGYPFSLIIHYSFCIVHSALFISLLPLNSPLKNDTLFAEKHTIFENLYLFASPNTVLQTVE
jgi:hypothetical protein